MAGDILLRIRRASQQTGDSPDPWTIAGSAIRPSAHKKGEVVEPAGGETGGPHCLAEV